MKLPLRLSFGCLLVMSFSATAKSYDFIQEHLEQAFSSSVVLSDSDVLLQGSTILILTIGLKPTMTIWVHLNRLKTARNINRVRSPSHLL